MTAAVCLLLALLSAGTLVQGWVVKHVTAVSGDTIVIPCNEGASTPDDLKFIQWKYVNDDGSNGDELVKQVRNHQPVVQATGDIAGRISMDDKFSLLITKATLKDQKTFNCIVVSKTDLVEYRTRVTVYSWVAKHVTAVSGDTIVIPCNEGASTPDDLKFIQWKYVNDDGSNGDELVKQVRNHQPVVQATGDIAGRISMDDKFSLLITKATLKDQKTFNCIVVSKTDLVEYRTRVTVYSWVAKHVTAVSGDTIVIPCNEGASTPDDLKFIQWKYVNDDGSNGDELVKQVRNHQPVVQATGDVAGRISMDDKFSLLITKATLKDQKTFNCIVVSETDLVEYRTRVTVYKTPLSVEVVDVSELLQRDTLTTVGTCVSADANPPSSVTWAKNGQDLVADGIDVVITSSLRLDPATGLSTTSSMLQYVASQYEVEAKFACISMHKLVAEKLELRTIPIHCESNTPPPNLPRY